MPKTKNDKIFKEIGSWINKRREELGYTQTKLAELIAMEPISIQRFESGYSKIAIDYLAKISKILKVDVSYFFNNSKSKSSIATIPALSVSDEASIDKSKYQTVPVYSFAGAGKFINSTEIEPVDTLIVPKDFAVNGSTVIVKVIGSSMEPMIKEGAYVGVDKEDKQFVAGKIYAIYLPYEGAVIKRVYLDLDNAVLKSENKDFPDIVIPFKKIDRDNFIIGRVKWVLQKF